MRLLVLMIGLIAAWPTTAGAQGGSVTGRVVDQTGAGLPGAAVEVTNPHVRLSALTDVSGLYHFGAVSPGLYELQVTLFNFASVREPSVVVADGAAVTVDARMMLAVTADVTVTGRGSFVNLADVEDPAASLVGVAFSASQGAVTGRQLETRPIMRAGEVLETVPGLIISQHSGEGKANQYYLRGFNLDHGTDFATTVAGVPVNLPTNGHGHGYSDANFLIPELVSGVQFSKGPYFAEQGDFSAAGSANVSYANSLDRSIVRVGGGGDGWARALVAGSPSIGAGHLLYALEVNRNDGPWERPDDYRKVNGVLRFSHGDAQNGFSLTAMGYRATWDATDQVPARAIDTGVIDRFGFIDATDGGETSRYSAAFDLQRSGPQSVTRVTAYGFHYDLNLFSNFTYFLDDPENGDQFEQTDSRFVTGGRVSHRRLTSAAGRTMQHTVGGHVRNDVIGEVGLYRTSARTRFSTIREDDVIQTSGAVFYENHFHWSPKARTQLGVRADLYHFDVTSDTRANSGSATSGIVSPKAGLVLGPWRATEVYVNAGMGFHSNDARGATIAIDPATGEAASRVTPLVRATGAEVGLRTVAIPRTQLTFSLWTLGLESELLFIGDAGTTEAGRPSRRTGIEVTAYHSPRRWLTLDADIALSRARFADADPSGNRISGSVEAVVSAGVSVNPWKNVFGSARLRYFGPRSLVEDGSVQSKATTLVNLEAGYHLAGNLRLVLDVFNLFDSDASDIDYFYESRLSNEPAAVEDIHVHPTLPRTARLGFQVGF